MTKRVYLAGPEVFLSNAREIGALKRAICERHGLVGVFPADADEALVSNEKAADWVRNNVMEFVRGMPEIMVGDVLVAGVK